MRSHEFERLYEAHSGPLLAFLVYRTGDRALAEDLLADTFERVLRSARGFDRRKSSESTWIYAIALNRLRDHGRRKVAESRALERTAVGASTQADSPTEQVGARDALRRALATLSDEEREAIALRYGAELTMPEIAKLSKQKLTTVEARVYRALRKLRDELG